MTFELNAIAQSSTLRIMDYLIVDCLLQGTLIALFVGGILRVSGRQNSGARFAVWFSALVAIAALPLLGAAWWPHAANISAETAARPAISMPGSWAIYLFAGWAAIAAWHLLGVGRSLRHLYILRKSCVAVDPASLDPQLQETLARNQSPRPVALCTSDRVQVPTAIGLVKPAVVIPRWVMQELSTDELNQILLHELAHLRRWDDWTNLAQKIVKALFFFHPAVWWIERRVSLEREMACDDAVLAETASPRAYAECLAHLAEKTFIQRSVALAQAALGKIRHTSLRVARILDLNRDMNRAQGTGRAWKPAASLIAAFALVCVLGVSRSPRLIAFSDGAPASSAAPLDAAIVPETGTEQLGKGRTSTTRSAATLNASLETSEPQVRIVPASFNPRQTPLQNSSHLVSGQSSKSKTGSTFHLNNVRHVNAAQISARPAKVLPTDPREVNIHLTNSDFAPVFTETLFVVIQGNENGNPDQPLLQIQLWRVMVFHPVVNPSSNRIPAKQT
jgi:beta-lactamase regulating signal transducer with metallopeptidase domain